VKKMSEFYQYECKDCEALFFTEWKSSLDTTKPYCSNCGNDQTPELTGTMIVKGEVIENE
jgi:predicted SprT family Zn-dependent metalloprotease